MSEDEKGFVVKDRRSLDKKGDLKEENPEEKPEKESPEEKKKAATPPLKMPVLPHCRLSPSTAIARIRAPVKKNTR